MGEIFPHFPLLFHVEQLYAVCMINKSNSKRRSVGAVLADSKAAWDLGWKFGSAWRDRASFPKYFRTVAGEVQAEFRKVASGRYRATELDDFKMALWISSGICDYTGDAWHVRAWRFRRSMAFKTNGEGY